jgi:hypothetical protein
MKEANEYPDRDPRMHMLRMVSVAKNAEVLRYQLFNHSEKYYFTPSGLDMLHAVYERYKVNRAIPVDFDMDTPLWCEYETPEGVDTADNQEITASLYWYPSHNAHSIDHTPHLTREERDAMHDQVAYRSHLYNLENILPNGYNINSYIYDSKLKIWIVPPDHYCPTGECTTTKIGPSEITQPCITCFNEQVQFISTFITSLKMINKEYAVSASPPDYKTEDRGFTEEKIEYVPSHNKAKRKRGEKEKKIKQVYTPLVFKMITFEVSETPSHTSPEEHDDIERAKRDNWLVTTPRGDIIYKKHSFEDLSREYRGDRYRDIIKRVMNGLRQEGETHYTLHYDSDGSPYVVGTIQPFKKYVLYKKDTSPDTMKRVTARRYKK